MTASTAAGGAVRLPPLSTLVAINRQFRTRDEGAFEPDDIERVRRTLSVLGSVTDPVEAASSLAFHIARAQGFGEGNKRTALLAARWVLDRNDVDGAKCLPPHDRALADLLVKASMGIDVQRTLHGHLRAHLSRDRDETVQTLEPAAIELV